MPATETKYCGRLVYGPESVFDFPAGLPGFEDQKRFVFIETPQYAPLVFLQSLQDARLCFLALPVQVVDPNYRLAVAPEDLAALNLSPDRQPVQGVNVLALALISLGGESSPSANLMAPIVVNLATRGAVQAIRHDSAYSHQQAIPALTAANGSEEAC